MRWLIAAVLPLLVASAWAKQVYQRPEAFLGTVFEGSPPAPQVLWLTGGHRNTVQEILGHPPNMLRVRYWAQGQHTAWVLEEIGKEKPITVGISVKAGRIHRMAVLIYRESRGMEVRHPFFTEQFEGADLGPDLSLDRPIDGISGATLSVRALTKLARLALYLHRQVRGQG